MSSEGRGDAAERGERTTTKAPGVVAPYRSFAEACDASLVLLQERLGFALVAVTRVSEHERIVLHAQGRLERVDVRQGDVLRWVDRDRHERDARGDDTSEPELRAREVVEVLRGAARPRRLVVGSYVGRSLLTSSGERFGSLCAFDDEARPTLTDADLALLEVIGDLLATALDRDLRVADLTRRADAAESAAMLDELTSLWNRRAWNHFAAREDARSMRYGHPVCVLSIDLDGLKLANDTHGHAYGDRLLRDAGRALRESVREHDVVARVGGDEFAVLLIECGEEQGRAVEARVRHSLERAGVDASVGFARRDPSQGIDEAWLRADAAMYAQKRQHKSIPPG